MSHTHTFSLNQETISLETGNWAKQAHGSVVYRTGNLVLLATVCASDEAKDGQDFFPLSCEYTEKMYSVGKVPGGYFKREAKPSEHEILISRIIDRPIRPMFPEGYFCDVQLIVQVLSADKNISTAGHAVSAASAAIMMAGIPFEGPVSSIRVGRINGQFVCNPTPLQILESDIDLVVAGTKDAIVMIEGEANEISTDDTMAALEFAKANIHTLCIQQLEFAKKVGVQKKSVSLKQKNEAVLSEVKTFALEKLREANKNSDKTKRNEKIKEVNAAALEQVKSKDLSDDEIKSVKAYLHELEYEVVRDLVLTEGIRYDARKTDEIRAISVELGVLPGPHGSAVFTRGQTQSLGVVTLGSQSDNQRYETIEGQKEKNFYLHYNFPAFSVGEIKKSSGPGRREIGHGNLAERALKKVTPNPDSFPYVIRVVSEILESNGSSSMASVCSGTLALHNAGVPMKAPVSGIAMGLFTDSNGRYAILSDIAGIEDHFGDMDFKLAGTRKGITAFQMDLKVNGLGLEVLREAIEQANRGRMHILGIMEEAISKNPSKLSERAPRIVTRTIPRDRIGELIGPGGKNIRSIIEQSNSDISIDDSGKVTIASPDEESLKKAMGLIDGMFEEVEVGKIYSGKVKRIADFGAFVEILPGKDGLVHISKLDHRRVNSVREILSEGDTVQVKVLSIDKTGKIDLSRKDALPRPE